VVEVGCVVQELPRLHLGGRDVMAEAAPQVRAVRARVVDLQGRRQLLGQGGSGAGVRDGAPHSRPRQA